MNHVTATDKTKIYIDLAAFRVPTLIIHGTEDFLGAERRAVVTRERARHR